MTSSKSVTGLPGLSEGRFVGHADFTEMIRQAFASAVVEGWRQIILSDPDFNDWPLGERGVTQALNDWSKTGRKLTMMAGSYETVLGRHARFAVWRRTWAHIVECRASVATPAGTVPSAFWSPSWTFERVDVQRFAGVAGSDVVRRVALKERLNEQLLNSSPAFPASVLGL